MAVTFTEKLTLVKEECISCGVVFAIPDQFRDNLIRNGGHFCCPNGHRQGWNEGTEQRTRRQAQQKLAKERQQHDQTKAALRDSEEKRKRVEDRIKNGVCPCCNRSFKNVRRHMKNKHPEFT